MSIYLQSMMEHGEYIDLGESWLVYLSEYGLYKLEDREVRVNGGAQFFVKPGTEISKITCYNKELVHYEKDGEILSVKDYNAVHDKFRDEDTFEYDYSSLEEEFEHRKELENLRDYTQIFTQKEDEVTPVPLSFVGSAQDTGNKYITTAFSYGKAKFGNSGFYEVNFTAVTSDTFWEFIGEYSLKEVTTNDFKRNYVRFAKVKGTYVVGDSILGAEEKCKRYYTTLRGAEEAIESHKKAFTRHLKIKIFGDETPLDGVSVKHVFDKLSSIKSSVSALDVKQKGVGSKAQLLHTIEGLINDVKGQM